MTESEPYDPLATKNLERAIVLRMLEIVPKPLESVGEFTGAGIYAIYYTGPFELYEDLTALNKDELLVPIYVGKAVPEGSRRGLLVRPHSETYRLSRRIGEHATSIRNADNLDISDFAVRWIVTDEMWITLGERALIKAHRPVWNSIVDGFGNHDPGKGRIAGVRSAWDTLHPGRPWASRNPENSEPVASIAEKVRTHLRSCG